MSKLTRSILIFLLYSLILYASILLAILSIVRIAQGLYSIYIPALGFAIYSLYTSIRELHKLADTINCK